MGDMHFVIRFPLPRLAAENQVSCLWMPGLFSASHRDTAHKVAKRIGNRACPFGAAVSMTSPIWNRQTEFIVPLVVLFIVATRSFDSCRCLLACLMHCRTGLEHVAPAGKK